MQISINLQNAYSIEKVVAMINDGGTCEFTADQIAGQYAFDAAENKTAEEVDAHLDYLKENGAIFDYHEAMKEAESFILDFKAAQDESESNDPESTESKWIEYPKELASMGSFIPGDLLRHYKENGFIKVSYIEVDGEFLNEADSVEFWNGLLETEFFTVTQSNNCVNFYYAFNNDGKKIEMAKYPVIVHTWNEWNPNS